MITADSEHTWNTRPTNSFFRGRKFSNLLAAANFFWNKLAPAHLFLKKFAAANLFQKRLAAANKFEISRPAKYENSGRAFWVQSDLAALTDEIRDKC